MGDSFLGHLPGAAEDGMVSAPACSKELLAAEDLPGLGLWEASPIPHQADSQPDSYRWEGAGQVGKQEEAIRVQDQKDMGTTP